MVVVVLTLLFSRPISDRQLSLSYDSNLSELSTLIIYYIICFIFFSIKFCYHPPRDT